MFLVFFSFMFMVFSVIFMFMIKSFSVFIWFSMEIFMWAMIPFFILQNKKTVSQSEMMMKFFIFQMGASQMWLLSVLFFFFFQSFSSGSIVIFLNWMFLSSLFMKFGLFPFHGWIWEIMQGKNYLIIYLMLGFQKFIPLFLMLKWISLMEMKIFLKLFILLNLFFVCWGFLNFSSLVWFIYFSSIYHLSILIFLIQFWGSSAISLFYFGIYLFFFSMFIFFIYSAQISFPPTMCWHMKEWSMFIFFLSMSGFPPYMMFFLKMYFFYLTSFFWGDLFLLGFIPPMFIYLMSFMWLLFDQMHYLSPVKMEFWSSVKKATQESQEMYLIFGSISLPLIFFFLI